MKRPNILLICVDQMRGDCMGNSGNPVVETPYLDTMAYNGVSFDHAYSAVPTCIAARCSLHTGQCQNRHRRKRYKDGIPFNYEYTMAGELAKAGYHTQCVGKMHVYPTRNLMGFHNVVLHDGFLHSERSHDIPYREQQNIVDDYFYWLKKQKGIDADITDTCLEANSWMARPWVYEEKYHPTNWVVSESIDFLRRKDPTKPFFLMTSFVRPHSPLDPPEYYYNMYKDKDIDPPIHGDWEENFDEKVSYNGANGRLPEAQMRRQKGAYYACITHIDHQIGRLLQEIIDLQEMQNTVVIFLSDHGDMLGDHNCFKKKLPYEGSCRIPLIIYDPGDNLHIPKGEKCSKIAEIRDIMPTLLDIAGAEVPPTVDGESLLHAIKGMPWREELIGQHEFGLNSNHFVVTEHDKYIYYENRDKEQYFDLDKDRKELHSDINDAKYKERIDNFRKIIKEYIATETPTL